MIRREDSHGRRLTVDASGGRGVGLSAVVAPPSAPTTSGRRSGPYAWSLDWSVVPLTAVATFRTFVASMRTRTQELDARYRGRLNVPGARPIGPEPQTVLEMPALPGGECPANGALAYIYVDIFDAAKENLRLLGESPPVRWAPVDDVLDWQKMVSWNAQLLIHATNIRPMFLFATATEPSNADPANNYHRADTDPLRTLITYPDGYREGRKERWSNTQSTSAVIGAQGVLDIADAMRRANQCFYLRSIQCAPDIAMGGVDIGFWEPFGRRVEVDHNAATLGGRAAFGRTTFTAENTIMRRAITDAWQFMRPYSERITLRTLDGGSEQVTVTFYVTRWIEYWDQVALALSRVDLVSLLKESLGFYVSNHNIWYAAALGMTPAEADAQRRAAQTAALESSPWHQAIRGISSAVAGAMNPAAGAIVNVLYQLSAPLFDNFILGQFETDAPRPFFVRVPPLSCRAVALPATPVPGTPAPAPGTLPSRYATLPNGLPVFRVDTTVVPKNSGSGAVLGAAALVGLAFAFMRK